MKEITHIISPQEIRCQGSDTDQYLSHATEGISLLLFFFYPSSSTSLPLVYFPLATHCKYICSTLSSISLLVLTVPKLEHWFNPIFPDQNFLTHNDELSNLFLSQLFFFGGGRGVFFSFAFLVYFLRTESMYFVRFLRDSKSTEKGQPW